MVKERLHQCRVERPTVQIEVDGVAARAVEDGDGLAAVAAEDAKTSPRIFTD